MHPKKAKRTKKCSVEHTTKKCSAVGSETAARRTVDKIVANKIIEHKTVTLEIVEHKAMSVRPNKASKQRIIQFS